MSEYIKYIDGVAVEMTQAEIDELLAFKNRPPTPEDVNKYRDELIESGVTFRGKVIETDEASRENIGGASTLALAAISMGAQKYDYHWHGNPDEEFGWITQDNDKIPLDAFDMIQLGSHVAAVKSKIIFNARNIKNMDPIPVDYKDSKYWA